MRSPPRPPSSLRRGRAKALAALAAGLLAACTLADRPEDEAYFDLEADPALSAYSRVQVTLQDSLGNPRATLYDDSLASPAALRRLPAGPYRGGSARLVIIAFRSGEPMYRETRVYDGATQRVLAVDIALGPFGSGGPVPVAAVGKPPALAAVMPDTAVSIRDSVALWAEAVDPDGDLAGYALDCDADGRFEDSAAISGYKRLILRGRTFPDSGKRSCRLKIWDQGSRSAEGRLQVDVRQDPPVADAGEDTTVVAGTWIRLHARGDDKFGPIVTREWKIGAKPFAPVAQQETVHEAPSEPGALACILRVTDSDGLAGLDTVVVTVIPRTGQP